MKEMLIFLLVLSMCSSQEVNTLDKIWEKQDETKHNWQTYNYQYIQFTNDKELLFFNGFGEIVENYEFNMTTDSVIHLSNGEEFGRVLQLTKKHLSIEKTINGGNLIPIVKNTYTEIVETIIDDSIEDILKHISNNVWQFNLDSKSDNMVLGSLKFDEHNINKGKFNIRRSDDFIKEYLVRIEYFNGSYSIFLNDKERPYKSDLYKITKIGTEEIHISFYKSDVGNMVLKRKKV